MSHVQTRTLLYHSPPLSVIDFACRVHPHRCGTEEVSDAHGVVFVRSGAFTRTIGSESILADPTQVLFFARAQPYVVTHPIPGGDDCTIIQVAPETLLEVVRHHSPRHGEIPDAPFAHAQTLNTARSMLLHYTLLTRLRRGERLPLAIHELALELLDEVLSAGCAPTAHSQRPPTVSVSPDPRDLVVATKTILVERYQNPPALDELARILGCSPFHLCRNFSRVVGVPMRRYLDRLRLRLSLVRLATGEPDLTGLALDLGYSDHSHFTNAFRREFGLAPSVFRDHGARKAGEAVRKNLQANVFVSD